MATFLQSDESPQAGGGNYFENDPIITRPSTLGLLDFSNTVCYAGGTPIPAYANLLNLVYGGTNATNGPNDRVLETGMLKFTGSAPDTNDYVLLPTTEFTLPTTCKKSLVSVAVVLPASGYGAPAANRYPLFFGRLNNTSAANINFGIWGIISTAGVLTSVQGASMGSVPVSATAQLALLTNGNKHVISVYSDGETTAGTLVTSIYVDNILVATATNSSWTTVPIPTNLPRIGSYPATTHSPWGGMKVGRPLIMDLTGKTVMITDIIAQEVALTNEYLV